MISQGGERERIMIGSKTSTVRRKGTYKNV